MTSPNTKREKKARWPKGIRTIHFPMREKLGKSDMEKEIERFAARKDLPKYSVIGCRLEINTGKYPYRNFEVYIQK